MQECAGDAVRICRERNRNSQKSILSFEDGASSTFGIKRPVEPERCPDPRSTEKCFVDLVAQENPQVERRTSFNAERVTTRVTDAVPREPEASMKSESHWEHE